MGEDLIDELWNRCFTAPEPPDEPVKESCLHDFLSYDNGEPWCIECGEYLNVGKVNPAPQSKRPSTNFENIPFDNSSKEKYFLSVLENLLGEEAISNAHLSSLKTLSDTHRENIQTTCTTRKDVQNFIKIKCDTSDRKLVNSHLGMFIRLSGGVNTLSMVERSRIISDYEYLLYQGHRIRPKSHLLSILTKPLSWA